MVRFTNSGVGHQNEHLCLVRARFVRKLRKKSSQHKYSAQMGHIKRQKIPRNKKSNIFFTNE